jgi:hypothetical protein
MTRCRHWLVGVVVALLFAGGAVVWVVTRPQPNLSDEAVRAITGRIGKITTAEELAAIIGLPPGDYSKGNRSALAEQIQAIHVPNDEGARLAMTLFVPGERSSTSYQRAIAPRSDSHQVAAWWGRKTSLAVLRDEAGEVQAVVILPWIRSVPTTFLERCEDWLYAQTYGRD